MVSLSAIQDLSSDGTSLLLTTLRKSGKTLDVDEGALELLVTQGHSL